jgi:hypothetical protein
MIESEDTPRAIDPEE